MDVHMKTVQSVRALEEAVAIIFQNNFDTESKACLVTLIKLLDNILQKPDNPKVRSIRLANKAFNSKVGSRKGGIEFLLACGFERQAATAPLLSVSDSGEHTLILTEEGEDTSHLVVARRLLTTRAIHDLGMQPEELPPYHPPPVVAKSSAAGSAASAAAASSSTEFNPYRGQRFDAKSAAVGENLGPDASYVSHTESKLQTLQAQQAALEAKLHKPIADRAWRAFLPHETVVAPPSDETSKGPEPLTDSQLLAQRMKKQQQEKIQREQGGFTTKAMRDVERLKNKKVYTHATLTVAFPDGCKLLGKFLPKERVKDVKASVQDCLNDSTADFDLYVAPPRRLLDLTNSLEKEDLVPAAKIFASWKVASAPPKTAPVGAYLKQALFSAQSTAHFPAARGVAESLKNESEKAPSDSVAGKKAKVETAEEREAALMRRMLGGKKGMLGSRPSAKKKDDDKKGGNINKPKWFK